MTDDELYENKCFQFFLYQHGEDFFTCHVFRLIQKADLENREKIRLVFPIEVAVFEEWRLSPSEDAFYLKHCPAQYQDLKKQQEGPSVPKRER